ncbi:MAG: hypothetical protein LBR37_01345 [Erysipelotrichaceae bacterium]|jgi:hypothetical protein|nr:hypothetical protein [Erysipelotrichaceae bacterium]
MKKRIHLIAIPLISIVLSSCDVNKLPYLFTPINHTGVATALEFPGTSFLVNDSIKTKLYYSHDTADKNNGLYSDCYLVFTFIISSNNGLNKIELLNETQTADEFYDITNQGGKTSSIWFFAYPTFKSFYEITFSFNSINYNEGSLIYELLVFELDTDTEVDSFPLSCAFTIEGDSVYLH